MIASLRGTVAAVAATQVVLDVAGVGFVVLTTPATAAALRLGETAALHTHLAVREDALTLYGFADPADRTAFLTVQTAAGVGPKLALAIVSVLGSVDLAQAIAGGDLTALTRVPGVGRKVAERLVVELKDKVALLAAVDPARARPSGDESWRDQVTTGLTGLGYALKDAERAVDAVASDWLAEPPAVAEAMRTALRYLAKR